MGYRAIWLVFACWASAGACQGGEVPGIRIGLLPDDSAQALLFRFEPMRGEKVLFSDREVEENDLQEPE